MSEIKISYDSTLNLILKEGVSINANEDIVNSRPPEMYSTFVESNQPLKISQEQGNVLIIPDS